jgi:hypothetical protein
VRSAGFEPAASGISGQPLCHVGVRAHGAFGPARTGCLFLTGEALWPGELRRHRVLGAIRTHTAQLLMLVPLAVGLRGQRSRRPVPIRTARLTKTGPQPCAAAWLPGLDSNQRWQGSGPCGGPQRPTRNRCGRRDSNSHTAGFEPARYPSSLSRPHSAPPGARTLFPWIKSPVLHPYSSRRAERHAGVGPAFPGLDDRHTKPLC